jgi:putative aminopeptidase FrvX
MKTLKELMELCRIPGVSGREEKVREKIIEMTHGYNHEIDDLGNLIVEVGEGDPIMIMAHMDEIGFFISNIRNDGKLVIRKIGGISDELLPGRHVDVITSAGRIDGVIGSVPPHLQKDGLSFEPVVDVGSNSLSEVMEMGIKVFDFVVFKKHESFLNDRFVSVRSLDDRAGCYALVETLKRINPKKHVIFAWTVQEEIGLKGSKALSERYKPSKVYAIDAFACCSNMNDNVKPGLGPVLRMIDNSAVASFEEMDHLLQIAQSAHLPLQVGVTGGGTDGSVFIEKGFKMVPITFALKYMHSEVEMMSLSDLENLIKLLVTIIEEN